jgi:hypothetical protein
MTWRPDDRRTRLLVAALCGVFGAYFGLYALATLTRNVTFRFGDFFALWSYGKVLATHPAAELYDFQILLARQLALGMPSSESNPFPYPPSFLPVVWPLGLLSYDAAYAAFIGVTLCLYLFAVAAGARSRVPLLLVALIAPGTTITLVSGQSGFLAGALLLAGIRLAGTRPLLGGVLLGLLAYKPQLGFLVPVALAAAGWWRAIAAAAATVAVVALATSAAFGWHIWADWLAYLPAYADQFQRESTGNDQLMPTLTANLRMLGVASSIARPAQAALALLAAVWVWRAFRLGGGPRATLVLVTATFLGTPHAFVYDLPMLTGAVLLFIADRAGAGFSTFEVAALALALVLPAAMAHAGPALPLSTECLALLAAALLAHRRAAEA